ncbi:hypothetical protein A5646_03590 [Mycobacterium sp. 1245499.0]|nr:hypothetical protein A5646_03590 [Mycobacterium sp. 1245499.0]
MAIGDTNRRLNQKVSISRSAPINLNTDADALKVSIVEWLSVAAARVAEQLNINPYHRDDDGNETYVGPEPQNHSDAEHVRAVNAAVRILEPNIDKLVALGADDVTVWLSPSETDHAGESVPYTTATGHTAYRPNTRVVSMAGAELALELIKVRRKARNFLMLTAPTDKMALPCPYCGEYELVRCHRTIKGHTKEIDQIDCGNCQLSWPYERYQHLCEIWVKEDEMEREKLQKQLDSEKTRREIAEWLLAEREWQLSLAFDFPDVSASVFVTTILSGSDTSPPEAFMSDRDIANMLNVSDSTVRSWASRGQITRHTAEDGSTVFLASEVWAFAKTNTGGRASTMRRLSAARRINDTACAT